MNVSDKFRRLPTEHTTHGRREGGRVAADSTHHRNRYHMMVFVCASYTDETELFDPCFSLSPDRCSAWIEKKKEQQTLFSLYASPLPLLAILL